MGVGPAGTAGLSAAAIAAVALADAAFADGYTALLPGATLEALERARKGPIPRLGRNAVEEGTAILEAAGRPGGAALVVQGDPMAATTHISLRLEALRRGIPVRLVFAPSITHTAFSEAGLQHYKAGRTVTLPFPEKGYSPTSPFHHIAANLRRGLHTLVLLDIKAENQRLMTAAEGVRLLLAARDEAGAPLFAPSTLVAAVARAGEPDCIVRAGAASRVEAFDLGPPMHCLIVPGALHFEEREALKLIGGARDDELPPER